MSTFIQVIWMKVDLVFKKFSVKIFDNISKIQTHLYSNLRTQKMEAGCLVIEATCITNGKKVSTRKQNCQLQLLSVCCSF